MFLPIQVSVISKTQFYEESENISSDNLLLKNIVRHFGTLRLCDVITTTVLRCHNSASNLIDSVATTLSTEFGKTLVFNKLLTLTQQIV